MHLFNFPLRPAVVAALVESTRGQPITRHCNTFAKRTRVNGTALERDMGQGSVVDTLSVLALAGTTMVRKVSDSE